MNGLGRMVVVTKDGIVADERRQSWIPVVPRAPVQPAMTAVRTVQKGWARFR
jgi:hypothetical protein